MQQTLSQTEQTIADVFDKLMITSGGGDVGSRRKGKCRSRFLLLFTLNFVSFTILSIRSTQHCLAYQLSLYLRFFFLIPK